MGRPKKNAVTKTGKKIAAAKEPEFSIETVTDEPGGEEILSAEAENAAAAAGKDTNAEKDGEASGKRLFDEDQVQKMIAEAVAKATRDAVEQTTEALKAQSAPKCGKTVGQDEMVTVLYLDEVSQNSTLELPGYGSIRPQSYIEIPKKEFGNKFMGIAIARKLIARRHLIVMDGLSQEERERWGCDYKNGELLDERTFDKMLDYPTPMLAEIFANLCPEHQRFVATRMITAKEKNDSRISVEKAKKINDLSKKNDPNGMLRPIMEAFGAEIAG